jgi:hypothetical protein
MTPGKSFINYVAETKKEYNYLIKLAVNDVTDSTIDCLETCLAKYQLNKASAFRKTPIQESPLDFPNIKNSAVFMCDISMGYPASLDFLRNFIANSTGISESQIAVYSSNDPRQIETDLYVDRNSSEYKAKYKTRLGSDYEEVEGAKEATYGEKYNVDFLKELEQIRKEREVVEVENALSRKQEVDHSTLGKDYDNFNDHNNLNKDDLGLFGRIKRPDFTKVGVL